MGRGLVYQLSRIPGMFPALVVNRTPQHALEAYCLAGFPKETITVSDDVELLGHAVAQGRPAVTSTMEIAAEVPGVEAIIEATGAVELGARLALAAIRGHKHFVSFNAETDATVGCLLRKKAAAAGVVYSNGDGDQPGVLMRMVEYVAGCGFEVVAAVNCKGFMDIRATPDSIKPWAEKQKTSLRMTAAFTDGTKMNIEQNVLCNATGLLPARRGMIGVKTDLKGAVKDFSTTGALRAPGIVDYTLGGDFGGGVFVIGRAVDSVMVQPYLKYLKMGDGPDYMFYRPYHLCHVETPLSAAEAVLLGEATIAPLGKPLAQTITLAKRDLKAGQTLDGIGGFNQYGQIEVAEKARGFLPIGLAQDLRLKRDVKQDQPVPVDAVELDEQNLLVQLWREQESMT
jgi:predicted homoserine dehydrogenase-like protein